MYIYDLNGSKMEVYYFSICEMKPTRIFMGKKVEIQIRH